MEDTPTRSKSGGPPLSTIEDSPVFNFMNNLSPIQPVKTANSVHIAHTHQSLNLASLSSIFSSPHANPSRETRSLSRPSFVDFSKPENCSGYAAENIICSEVCDAARSSSFGATSQENCTVTCLLNEAIIDSPDQCPTVPSTLAHSIQYGSGSPNHMTTPSYVVKPNLKVNIGHTPVDFVPLVQNGVERQKKLFATECEVKENHPFELNEDKVLGCDWETLMSDEAGDLLIFDSSIEPEAQKGMGEEAEDNDVNNSFVSLLPNCTENDDALQKTQPDIAHVPCIQNVDQDHPMNYSEGSTKNHDAIITKMLPGTSQSQVDNHQRGIRRRCLVFDVAGVSIGNICSESNLKSSTSLSSKGKSICDVSKWRASVSPSLCALPGIGLHLNALATTSKDRMVSKETLASGKQLISTQSSTDPFPSTTAERNNQSECLPIEKDLSPIEKVEELQVIHHSAEKDTAAGNCDELSQDSPKKKRRKSENGGENEGCNRCNCKKSKCLKLYCVCFAAGVYCSEPCSCQGCFNKPIHEETVLATRKQIESRNPLAFAPKVIQPAEAGPEMGDDNNKTPASARHKRGCNCKKSNCLKKYCECYQGGVGCSISCRCEGCKNAYGRKDGTLPGAEEIEQAEEENGVSDKEKESLDDDQQTAGMQIGQHFSGNILPLTPYQSCRLSIDMPSFSSAKPPRITKLSILPSPGLYGSHMLQKSGVFPEHKFENNVKTGSEDDTPDILKPSASPAQGVKIASPNCKRVSPPHTGAGISPPNRKGCRKLILKSIPSFPSLNNDVSSEYSMNYPNSSFSSST
ncbi:hypothetical protein Cni_G00457 [Canna indica]|uniref:CRC domain-containing protein n=1 Tax=Canna indica TaxID=4628 RepID=A0AAQ3JMS3_9LILI|nr:hypothetical protein Cni_G00457 [Canna indica]